MHRVSLHFSKFVDGTMCTLESADAPEFFLHHGFIDKLWDDWQKKSKENKYVFFRNIKTYMNGRFSGRRYLPRAFLELNNQPGCVKVRYARATIPGAKRVRTMLSSKYKFFVVVWNWNCKSPSFNFVDCNFQSLWYFYYLFGIREFFKTLSMLIHAFPSSMYRTASWPAVNRKWLQSILESLYICNVIWQVG